MCKNIITENLSDDRKSEKTRVYENIYDFVVDYKPIVRVESIYDMHKYLMIKHGIK